MTPTFQDLIQLARQQKHLVVRYYGISHFFFHLNEGLTFFAITYILGVYVVKKQMSKLPSLNLLTFEVILEVPFITKKYKRTYTTYRYLFFSFEELLFRHFP